MWSDGQRRVHRGVHQPRQLPRAALRLRGPRPRPELSVVVHACLGARPLPRHRDAGLAQATGPQRCQRDILCRGCLLRDSRVVVHHPSDGLLAERHGLGYVAFPGAVLGLPVQHHGHRGLARVGARGLRNSAMHTARQRGAQGPLAGDWRIHGDLPCLDLGVRIPSGRLAQPLRSGAGPGFLALLDRSSVHRRVLHQQGHEACQRGGSAAQEAVRAEVQRVRPRVAGGNAGGDRPLGRGLVASRRRRRRLGKLRPVRRLAL
mmetsp:Transcript_71384/g.159827  ORF Transcript_71384/g.159827 Transcript_71384/m.159827 type:complete len:261 (-) Transcript_71384:173-955(-)